MPRNDTRRPLVLGKISQPRIGDYLKKRDEYINLPARIDRHGIKILYKGKWLTKPELDAVFKMPTVPNFTANLENFDRTKLWQYI